MTESEVECLKQFKIAKRKVELKEEENIKTLIGRKKMCLGRFYPLRKTTEKNAIGV